MASSEEYGIAIGQEPAEELNVVVVLALHSG
jgi:hypothetical protein